MEATVTLSVITAAAAGLHASSGACGYLSAAGADVADDEASFLKYRASLRIAGGALLYAGGRTGVAAAPPVALLGGAFAFAAAIPGFARLGGPMTLEGLSLLSLLLLGGLSLKGMVPFEDAFGMAVSVFTGVGFQWLVLPGFSVGLYKFATTVSADAITRAAQCGGTLLCGGVYMLLLRGKGISIYLSINLSSSLSSSISNHALFAIYLSFYIHTHALL